MIIFVTVLILLIALEHIAIGLMEMFATPSRQAEAFGVDEKFLEQKDARTAMANQGIYNLMLGVSLALSLWLIEDRFSAVRILLLFIVVVGIYGGATVNKKIYFVQALPALIVSIIFAINIVH